VSEAAVSVEGEEVARIGRGLLVLLGVRVGDGPQQADRIAAKLKRLRIFEDSGGRMNLSTPLRPTRRSRSTNGSVTRSGHTAACSVRA
jgi:D-Tyr-tRNAtyr deacylase